MVIDGSKGVEPQTRKLFKVCAMRHIPIFTFINKMDREAKDPFDLCEEVEHELGIETCPLNWPIGSGKEFQGVYDRDKKAFCSFRMSATETRSQHEVELEDPKVGSIIGEKPGISSRGRESSARAAIQSDEVRAGNLSPDSSVPRDEFALSLT
jgi:peptide chain release factor 3